MSPVKNKYVLFIAIHLKKKYVRRIVKIRIVDCRHQLPDGEYWKFSVWRKYILKYTSLRKSKDLEKNTFHEVKSFGVFLSIFNISKHTSLRKSNPFLPIFNMLLVALFAHFFCEDRRSRISIAYFPIRTPILTSNLTFEAKIDVKLSSIIFSWHLL